jgi:hypothetical protein
MNSDFQCRMQFSVSDATKDRINPIICVVSHATVASDTENHCSCKHPLKRPCSIYTVPLYIHVHISVTLFCPPPAALIAHPNGASSAFLANLPYPVNPCDFATKNSSKR